MISDVHLYQLKLIEVLQRNLVCKCNFKDCNGVGSDVCGLMMIEDLCTLEEMYGT